MNNEKKFKKLKSIVVCLFLTHWAMSAQAQEQPNVMDETLTDAYTVLGTTMGGAILGLSTLSFVEEPGDHLKNIVVGGAIGIIVGVGIVAYGQASKSKDVFFQGQGQGRTNFKNEFNTLARHKWHNGSRLELKGEQQLSKVPTVSKLWTF